MLRRFALIADLGMLGFFAFAVIMSGGPRDEEDLFGMILAFAAIAVSLTFVVKGPKILRPGAEPSTFELFRLMVRAKLKRAARD